MRVLSILAVLLLAAYVFGPREHVDWTVDFRAEDLGQNLDAYLETNEGRIPNLIAGAEKEIIWAAETGRKTDLAIVYIHGFSATKREIWPVPQRLSEALGANVFMTRLTGHGRTGEALAGARANDWINDTVEALEIGRRLGERVVVIGVSTGGTLATLLAADAGAARHVAGLVLLSPNFGLQRAGASLLTKPFARTLVPLIAGETVGWTPQNAEEGRWWTTSYPTVALLPMAALVAQTRALEVERIPVPLFVVYSPEDTVVSPEATLGIVKRWGGRTETWAIQPAPGIDTSNHVLTGDILSPATVDETVARLTTWIGGL